MKSLLRLFSRAAGRCRCVAGCSGYRPAPAAFHEALDQPYRLGAGDRVRVTVFEQESLTNTYSVDQSGYIAFPLVGAVPARGHTVQQIEGEIAAKLRKGYLRDPDVSVEVDRYRPIFVMGEVGAAGQYSYVPGLTVQKAIAHGRRLHAARQPGQCRHHPRHQRQGDDRPRAARPTRCCRATRSTSANACSERSA